MLHLALGLTTALGPAPRAAGPRAHPSPPKRMHECSIRIAAMLRRWPRSRMDRADERAERGFDGEPVERGQPVAKVEVVTEVGGL